MVQRRQQPLIISIAIIGISLLMVALYFTSDLQSPALFLTKAVLQPTSLFVLLLFLCYSICSRNKWLVVSSVLACLVNAPFLLPNLQGPSQHTEVENPAELVVATFSTLTRTENTGDIASLATTHMPDLLCLQEVSEQDRVSLLTKLDNIFPHYAQNGGNQILLSRFPLNMIDDTGFYQYGTLYHPSWGEIGIINAHMPRPYQSIGISLVWEKLFSILNMDSKIILCGDLNITPNNTHYNLLRYQYNLDDAHHSGYGFTYPNAQRRSALFGPLIRIDYLLTRGLRSLETQTIDASNLSDHKAVLGKFILKTSSSNE